MLSSVTFLRIIVLFLLIIITYMLYMLYDLSMLKSFLSQEVKSSQEIVYTLKDKINTLLVDVDSLKNNHNQVHIVRETLVLSDATKNKPVMQVSGVSLNNRFIPDLLPIQTEFAVSQGFSDYHQSIDLAAPVGTKVYSSAAGIVIASYNDKFLGNVILIDHLNGYKTLYAHLHEFIAKINDFIEKGQAIGLVGNTGYSTNPHLHFQIYYNNDPINPETLMSIPKFKL